ncbi:MAG TPA: FHA domain-containing protein [Rhodanobacteraceae bacterium]|nr:FHA domain-containing protein [Rhodanobacteraceae bacterium]
MRLCFPNGEHADVVVDSGAVSVGSANGNGVTLAGPDIAPQHALIRVDQRGAVMEILDPAARTHVNARPVREKALLRLGDGVCFGAIMVVLKPDRDDSIEMALPSDIDMHPDEEPPTPSRVVLRGVSGAHFGKSFAIDRRLVVGRGGDCDLRLDDSSLPPQHAAIENVADSVYLRDLGSSGGTFVNGVAVKDAVLYPGDQIAFARNRFLLEAPGLPLRGQVRMTPRVATPAITQFMTSVGPAAPDAPVAAPRNGVWWLIGVAALIGLGLAALLLWGI